MTAQNCYIITCPYDFTIDIMSRDNKVYIDDVLLEGHKKVLLTERFMIIVLEKSKDNIAQLKAQLVSTKGQNFEKIFLIRDLIDS